MKGNQRTLIAKRQALCVLFVIVTVISGGLTPNAATAATYYVATNGSNSNPGTLAQPFQTIQKAADVVQPGDVVYVRAGTYAEFAVRTSGSPGSPITFRNYSGETVTVQPSSPLVLVTIYIVSSNYIIIDGFLVKGGLHEGILINGPNASNNQVLNCEVSGAGRHGIFIFAQAHNNLVKNNRVHDNVTENWPRGTAAIWGTGTAVVHGSLNNVFEDNYIYWNHGEGFVAENVSDGTIFRRNVVADNWSANVYINGSKNAIVENNFIYHTSVGKFWPSILPPGDPHANDSNSPGLAVSIEVETEFFGVQSVDNLTIRNNIVVNGLNGLRVWVDAPTKPVNTSGWLVANNTFVNNDDGIVFDPPATIRTSSFKNNIVWQGNGGFVFSITTPGPNLTFTNNLYFGSQNLFHWGPSNTTYTTWRSTSGEVASLWSDPRLQNASAIPPRFWSNPSLPPPSPILPRETVSGPYKLASGSPAIDAGVAIPGVVTDAWGTSRPYGNLPDIGAHEFAIGLQPPASPTNLRVSPE